MGSIPTHSFLANQVHFHLILLACDLINLVQAAVSAKQMAEFCLADDSYRIVGLADKIGLFWGIKRTQDPYGLYSPETFSPGADQYRALENSMTLLKVSLVSPSVRLKKWAFLRFFQG